MPPPPVFRYTVMLTLFVAASLPAQQEPLPPGVEMLPDVVYATPGGVNLSMDVYVPRLGPEAYPAVVFVHGGGWRSGSRRQFRGYAARLAAAGFVAATIDYRLSPQAKYPAALQDCRAAVRWLRTNAVKYRIDAGRIGLAGQSAGGHLVALLGTTLDTALAIRAVVAFNPVLDLAAIMRSNPGEAVADITAFLGVPYSESPALWREASPIAHVSPESAPMLLLHGTADNTVPYAQSVGMYNALLQAGVPVELYSAEGAGHLWFFNSNEHNQAAFEKMKAFFVRYLR